MVGLHPSVSGSTPLPRTNFMKEVIGAPQWLKDRMKALRQRPFPTSEQVQRQFAATTKWRKENVTKCDVHTTYKGNTKPKNDCHWCWDVFCAQNPDEPKKVLPGEKI